MPLSKVHVSPPSTSVTGVLTVGLAIFGSTLVAATVLATGALEACCATTPHVRATVRARNVEPQKTLTFVMMQPFHTWGAMNRPYVSQAREHICYAGFPSQRMIKMRTVDTILRWRVTHANAKYLFL